MKSDHYVGNISQKAIIEHDEKILVCRGIADTIWGFPGGRLHTGETPHEGLMREVKEEFDIEIEIISPVDVIRSYHRKSAVWQVLVAYSCTMVGNGSITINPAEIEESKWVTKTELKTIPMDEDCRKVADAFLKK